MLIIYWWGVDKVSFSGHDIHKGIRSFFTYMGLKLGSFTSSTTEIMDVKV